MAWQRKILRVDLTAGTCKSEPLNMQWAKAYLGQRGLCYEVFRGRSRAHRRADVPRQQADLRHRPLTGTMACSNSGGHWGVEPALRKIHQDS